MSAKSGRKAALANFFRFCLTKAGMRFYLVAGPSPTTANGAQYAGRASLGLPLAISASIDRRMASARPMLLSAAILLTAPVISFTVAPE